MTGLSIFEEHRSLLFSIAYRMLGSVNEAEDMVHETFLRVAGQDLTTIEYPKAYLSQITTRLCLDQLKSARHQREIYVGPWLPEPILTKSQPLVEPDRVIETMDSVSMAFMLLIETLSPAERAVFLLREVFDYSYEDIALILEKDESACRKLFSRAKKHLIDNRPRYQHDENQHQALLTQFLEACQTGDLQSLESVLASEVVVTVDGGGKVVAATHPIYGRDHSARFFHGIFEQGLKQIPFKTVTVNNQIGLVGYNDNQPVVLFMFENDGAQIQRIWAIRNPDKLNVV